MVRPGVPTLSEYVEVGASAPFRQMEEFSRRFLDRHEKALTGYARRWVADPLHHWSRRWEYPFVLAHIEELARRRAAVPPEHDAPAHPEERAGVPGPLEVLDAGSGVTFFPFFLVRNWEGARVRCCDVDETLLPVYERINRGQEETVELEVCDLRDTPYPASSFDMVCSVSVLEHTGAFEEIAEEIARILKPGGLLVLTIDVGLDGASDLSPNEAESMLDIFRRRMGAENDGQGVPALKPELERLEILTTREVADRWPDRLPWKPSLVRRVAGRFGFGGEAGRTPPRLLTVYCGSLARG